jgi:diguanylate cyclase (GGDEF)-like protein
MSLDETIERLEKFVAEVRQASLVDEMTGLGSIIALSQEGRLISEAVSEFDVVVFGDLNDFKHLNDDHTHAAGDVALKTVGELMLRIFVGTFQGNAFRQSGDEFVILLKQDSVAGFLSSVPSFARIPFSYNNEGLETGMTFGYARSDGKTGFDDLLERADVACQFAKADGNAASEWTEHMKLNPLVRIGGRCRKCGAKISCNIPKSDAPRELKFCPCCGESL